MALTKNLLHKVCERLFDGAKVAAIGYPDIIAPMEEVEKVLGSKIYRLKMRPDRLKIEKQHHIEGPFPDSRSFFNLLGATLNVFDIVRHRGEEIIVDLNFPIVQKDAYDFVIDNGTMEHCFNIGQAALNMAGLLKEGGIIFHENPFNWGNHGFYNLNPTWFADFYKQDGFELLEMKMIAVNCKEAGTQVDNVPNHRRFSFMKAEANICAIARRVKVKKIGFPVQWKYKSVIPAAGVPGERDADVRAIGA